MFWKFINNVRSKPKFTVSIFACACIFSGVIGVSVSQQETNPALSLSSAPNQLANVGNTIKIKKSSTTFIQKDTSTSIGSETTKEETTTLGKAPAESSSTTQPLVTKAPTSTVSTPTTNAITTVTQPATTAKPETTTTIKPTTTTAPTQPASLNKVELEIFNLVNEYRQNPFGRLARSEPLPAGCNSAKGLQPFMLDNSISIILARDWSIQMAQANHMSHRPLADQRKILEDNNTAFNTWGENVAWHSGYRQQAQGDPDLEVARVFFEGWRDSDPHLCNILKKEFTHIGIGHFYDSPTDKEWATQNFYG